MWSHRMFCTLKGIQLLGKIERLVEVVGY
nr:unnamed protein product [Callosobruchus chinensis]